MDERTQEILNRFSLSWEETAFFFDALINKFRWNDLPPILEFILRLRNEGYDQYFRLGTSLSSLLISRSVNHGLRADQKYIKIEVVNPNDFEVSFRNGEKTYRQYRLNDLKDERMSKLLKTLESTPVD